MLRIKSTVNNTGITVSGSYDDLKELCDAIESAIGDDGDYSYNAASRHRVQSVCNEIRHAWQGERETVKGNPGILCYAFRILWPDAAFVAAVLDNFVLLSTAKQLYVNRLPEELQRQIHTVYSNQVALIHYFQDLVWNELERVVGGRQVRTIFGEYNELRSLHFKFPQLDGFYTQWLDLLNIIYLCSKPEQRSSYLAAVLTRLFSIDERYLIIKTSIEAHAKQDGIIVTSVGLADCAYPDNIEW